MSSLTAITIYAVWFGKLADPEGGRGGVLLANGFVKLRCEQCL